MFLAKVFQGLARAIIALDASRMGLTDIGPLREKLRILARLYVRPMPFKFRKERYRFVNGTTLQLTLREWRDGFLNPIALIIMAEVGGVMGVAGPFGTQDTVAVVPRIIYWIWVVYSTYAIGLFFVTFLRPMLEVPKNNPIA